MLLGRPSSGPSGCTPSSASIVLRSGCRSGTGFPADTTDAFCTHEVSVMLIDPRTKSCDNGANSTTSQGTYLSTAFPRHIGGGVPATTMSAMRWQSSAEGLRCCKHRLTSADGPGFQRNLLAPCIAAAAEGAWRCYECCTAAASCVSSCAFTCVALRSAGPSFCDATS
mmetsp:Transcript_10726/g.28910  ORF Transcript_10726/g.28910 Transcript_10726/m.28910 type:complete len:168 (+) Transcript_10726:2176-2679(+)